MKLSRLFQRLSFYPAKWIVSKIEYINGGLYMKLYTFFLRKFGMHIDGQPEYIHASAKFDDFNLVSLSAGDVISLDVHFLAHDFSRLIAYNMLARNDIATGRALQILANEAIKNKKDCPIKRAINVGSNVFIGARCFILPGTNIGNNCIIGAGTVVRGNIPEGCIVIGNPAKIIGTIAEYGEKWLRHIN